MEIYVSNDRKMTVDTCKELVEKMEKGNTLLLHTEGIDAYMTQRIIDFLAGACMTLKFDMKKITNRDFLIIPENAELIEDGRYLF